ncbi:MAG: hypothetical protein JWO95_3409 [Verrucomicrobiales bacterium]|nr:hypothetical protein [Verrucomicrobiales bacterium]
MDNNSGQQPPTETRGLTPAMVGYIIVAIIVALIIWRFLWPH